MITALLPYLPSDRLLGLVHGQTLPDRTHGAALFADISGFTPLTETLSQQLGARRGIEELTRRINAVYEALIGVVEQYGGSVISFAGDAITCWFDVSSDSPSVRAVAAALAMQAAMRSIPELSLKVAVTGGPARRFVVGDPQIQLLDTLAGETIARLARAENLAGKGEVIADTSTVEACGETLQVGEWRTDGETNERFAVVASFSASLEVLSVTLSSYNVPLEKVREWVLPTVFEREQSGLGEFLTELRPVVALFVRFSGIDYDGDEQARDKLDTVVRRAQQLVSAGDGTLLQLAVGDKGSYVYACFGVPTAHEDDARRAALAALALRDLPGELTFLQPVHIGLSRGIQRVGGYGSATRRAYGVLGDEVNVAARLMALAGPNEILLSGRMQTLLGERFALEHRLPVTIKGKSGALNIFALQSAPPRRATRLLEPVYRLPMIGRQYEFGLIANKLELARAAKGQVIGITGEAGLGKSRLVAEAIWLAQRQGFASYGGACESSGTNSAYLAWKPIWQAFFDVDPTAPTRRQVRHLESKLEDRAPHRLQAMPLLAPILDLQIEDNDFTRTLEPKDRRNALEVLLEDCLKAAAKEEPVLFVLEDVHWIDPLSHDLLESLARATASTAVCFVLAYRPPELERLHAPRVEALPHFTKIVLSALTPADAEQLVRAKLAQLFPERGGGLLKAPVEQLTGKAQGNPFFIEELLNHLRDRGISPYDEQAPTALELPPSLYTLILSRIDQLTEGQKATLKVASIIGRLFPFAWLHGYYPGLGTPDTVKADLDAMARLDITPLDTPEPELAYLFKHVVTQEVTYESLAYATRAQLHEQLAQFLEGQGADKYLDRLAFHYGRSENQAKQREYFRTAGDAAQAAFANEAALDYYARLLPLLSGPVEQIDLHLRRGGVLELLGRWEEAEKHYRAALALAVQDTARLARCQLALGKLCRQRGDYPAAPGWLAQARQGYEMLQDTTGLIQALIETGIVFYWQGEFAAARQRLEEALALAREIGDKLGIARSLTNLGNVATLQGDHVAGWALHEESLTFQRQMGDRLGIASSLTNLGLVAFYQGDYATAQALLDESVALKRELGDKAGIILSRQSLGLVAYRQGRYPTAQTLLEENLLLGREIGDKEAIALSLLGLGYAALYQGDYTGARALLQESLTMSHTIGSRLYTMYDLMHLARVAVAQSGAAAKAAQLAGAAEALRTALAAMLEPAERGIFEQTIASARAALGEAAFNAAFEAGQKMTLDEAVHLALEED